VRESKNSSFQLRDTQELAGRIPGTGDDTPVIDPGQTVFTNLNNQAGFVEHYLMPASDPVVGTVPPWFVTSSIPIAENCSRDANGRCRGPCIWPNRFSRSNSDAWISENHDCITEMRPKILVINFANGYGQNGRDILDYNALMPVHVDTTNGGQDPFLVRIRDRVQQYVNMLAMGSQYHSKAVNDHVVPAFLKPEILRIVDLHDGNGKVNSDAFPSFQPPGDNGGSQITGYAELFTEEFARVLDIKDTSGEVLTLGQLVATGHVHEVIIVANQVDKRSYLSDGTDVPNDPYQVTTSLLEVASNVQVYDDTLKKIDHVFVRSNVSTEHKHVDRIANPTVHDANTMPWVGHSLRISFMNVILGAGALLHSFGHEIEYQYNSNSVCVPINSKNCERKSPIPYMSALFRRFAGFDMSERFKTSFESFYHFESYPHKSYQFMPCEQRSASDQAYCSRLDFINPDPGDVPFIDNYIQGCGNVHFWPGALKGNTFSQSGLPVNSFCETFQFTNEQPDAVSPENWKYLSENPAVNNDNGGDFLVYWMRNMPGLNNRAHDFQNRPMKNWWPFLYY